MFYYGRTERTNCVPDLVEQGHSARDPVAFVAHPSQEDISTVTETPV